MESDVNKELVFAYFARKTSPLQRERIGQWIRHQANEELYYQWLEEWENRHPQYRAETDRALDKYTAFLTDHPQPDGEAENQLTFPVQKGWNRRQRLVAASILILFSLGAFCFRDHLWFQTYRTAYGEIRSLTLSDGSTVLLNANSSLRVPRWGFGPRTREVWLTGEANFSVRHTPDDRKFVVRTTKAFEVVVLGTEFTVFARQRGTRVLLTKGQVRLQYREGVKNRGLTMRPGQQVTLDRRNHVALKTVEHLPPQPAWSQKRFVFDETPLQEVAYLLEENYGLQVEIRDSELAGRVLMGSFRADTVDQLLQSISELLDIDVVRQGDRVQLKAH